MALHNCNSSIKPTGFKCNKSRDNGAAVGEAAPIVSVKIACSLLTASFTKSYCCRQIMRIGNCCCCLPKVLSRANEERVWKGEDSGQWECLSFLTWSPDGREK